MITANPTRATGRLFFGHRRVVVIVVVVITPPSGPFPSTLHPTVQSKSTNPAEFSGSFDARVPNPRRLANPPPAYAPQSLVAATTVPRRESSQKYRRRGVSEEWKE